MSASPPAGATPMWPTCPPARPPPYASRDTQWLRVEAGLHGEAAAAFATRLFDVDLPWTRMRQVCRLYGPGPGSGSIRLDNA